MCQNITAPFCVLVILMCGLFMQRKPSNYGRIIYTYDTKEVIVLNWRVIMHITMFRLVQY